MPVATEMRLEEFMNEAEDALRQFASSFELKKESVKINTFFSNLSYTAKLDLPIQSSTLLPYSKQKVLHSEIINEVTENSVEGVDKKELLISENSSSSLSGKSYLVQSSLFDPPGKVKSVKINAFTVNHGSI